MGASFVFCNNTLPSPNALLRRCTCPRYLRTTWLTLRLMARPLSSRCGILLDRRTTTVSARSPTPTRTSSSFASPSTAPTLWRTSPRRCDAHRRYKMPGTHTTPFSLHLLNLPPALCHGLFAAPRCPLNTLPFLLPIHQWVPEVRHFCPNVPFLLVGCKMDLRTDPTTQKELAKMKQEPVPYQEVRHAGHARVLFCCSLLCLPSHNGIVVLLPPTRVWKLPRRLTLWATLSAVPRQRCVLHFSAPAFLFFLRFLGCAAPANEQYDHPSFLNCAPLFPLSTPLQENVRQVFEDATKASLAFRSAKGKKCMLL